MASTLRSPVIAIDIAMITVCLKAHQPAIDGRRSCVQETGIRGRPSGNAIWPAMSDRWRQ